jgi:hypothetical protein
VNLNATITSGGMDSAEYLVAAKFSPQKTAAKINEISVKTAALLLASVMPRSLTARARRSPAPGSLLNPLQLFEQACQRSSRDLWPSSVPFYCPERAA